MFAVCMESRQFRFSSGGSASFSKHLTIEEAKKHVTEEFKRNQSYIYANIYNQEDKKEIEKYRGEEWHIKTSQPA